MDLAGCTPPGSSLFQAWVPGTLDICADLMNSRIEVGFTTLWLSHEQLATLPLVLDFVKNESNFSPLESSTFCVYRFRSPGGATNPSLVFHCWTLISRIILKIYSKNLSCTLFFSLRETSIQPINFFLLESCIRIAK